MLFQNGIGAGEVTLAAGPAYREALRARLSGPLDVVVEIPESVPEAAEFLARPAPLDRIRAQPALARRATGRPPLCFSLPRLCYAPVRIRRCRIVLMLLTGR